MNDAIDRATEPSDERITETLLRLMRLNNPLVEAAYQMGRRDQYERDYATTMDWPKVPRP